MEALGVVTVGLAGDAVAPRAVELIRGAPGRRIRIWSVVGGECVAGSQSAREDGEEDARERTSDALHRRLE
jgi:hypothetical protein